MAGAKGQTLKSSCFILWLISPNIEYSHSFWAHSLYDRMTNHYTCTGNSLSFWSPKCLLKWNITLRFFIDTSKNLLKCLLVEFNLNFYNNSIKRLFWYKCKFAKYLSHYRQLSSQHHSSFLPAASRVAIKVSILGGAALWSDCMAFRSEVKVTDLCICYF